MITAPYNFVPLNEKVVTPYWGPAISHDKPFMEGKSGVLSVEMTAKSPIFVRNGEIGVKDKDGKDVPSPEFNQFGGNYFIPGSSIKGMLRNFIEIITFGKMEDKVNDVKYSVRDFTKGAKDAKIYNPSEISKESNCGWLRYDGRNYYLQPCSRPGRISHKALDKISGNEKMSFYYQQIKNISNDKQKSASAKYTAFPFKKEGHTFKYQNIEEPEDGIGREKYILDDLGQGKKGTIVFTGQPGIRKEEENQGKQYEFIFFDYNNPEICLQRDEEGKPHEIIRNLFHAYYDHDKGQQKEDWKWRKKQLLNGESIPIFYRLKDQSKSPSSSNLLDMGLALLFKTTYKYSVKQSILNFQEKSDPVSPDFADCLFGYIKKTGVNKFDSLKGRVMISHAFAQEGAKPFGEIKKEVLGGPKASYYPNYIRQNIKDSNGAINGHYLTFKDKNGVISGWKKYPVRLSDPITNPAPMVKGKTNEEVTTKFIPLESGTTFTFQIAYHNLRKEELGALISAITFHGNEDFFHSIGMAKPLGYGKISFSIKNEDQAELDSLLKEFECFMNYELAEKNTSWIDSLQVKELFAMSKPSEKGDANLTYQKMDMENRRNDFNEAKKNKLALMDYSKIVGPVSISGKASSQEIESKKQFHAGQESYFLSLGLKGKDDPTLPIKLATKKKLTEAVQFQKEALILQLKEKVAHLKEEISRQKTQKIKDIEQERIEGKRSSPINLDSVKLNSRGFETLEKSMKTFQIKFKDGPLNDEADIKILTGKLKEIYTLLPDKEKTKWKDSSWEENQYYKKISRWLSEELTKRVLQGS